VSDKGFGFIDGERGDLFFHHSEVQGVTFEELREGQEVSYEEGQGPKGPRAASVRLL
jgi:CspA family cold shock protein